MAAAARPAGPLPAARRHVGFLRIRSAICLRRRHGP